MTRRSRIRSLPKAPTSIPFCPVLLFLLGIEIERRFLLASERWGTLVRHSVRIEDGLIASSEDRKARVRIMGNRATLAIKTKKVASAREEFEYDIPLEDARRLMDACTGNVTVKLRHYVDHGGLTWEIDEYDGLLRGVVLAEVELASADQVIELPDWIGQEVTSQPPYRKINMLRARQRQAGHAPGNITGFAEPFF